MNPNFVFHEAQRFECRDCPARCCRLPVAIPLNPQEIERFQLEPWVRERVGNAGMVWIEKGIVPTRNVDRVLQCIFLDADGLCSMQKKLGHDFLPQTCQSFPFGFVSNEKNQLVAQMSQLCPAIRNNRGQLITVKKLKEKLDQKGGHERMSKAMATRHGRILNQSQFMRVAKRWLDKLGQDKPPAQLLLELYDWTLAFEDAIPGKEEKPDDASISKAIEAADESGIRAHDFSTGTPFQARMLHAYILGGLSYPGRVAYDHCIDKPSTFQALRAMYTKLKWLLGRGKVDLLYVSKPVPLKKVDGVKRFLSTPTARPISNLLQLIIERRQAFRDPRHMMEVLNDLALSTVVISRFARCRAASEQRKEVNELDVQEGIGVAELTLLGHVSQRKAGVFMRNTRRSLIAARENFIRVLASENDEG